MLEFKPITILDRAWITALIKCEDSRSADASFGAMFLWNNEGPRFTAKSGDRLIFMRFENGTPLILCPFGTGPINPVISQLKEYCAMLNKPLVLVGVTEEYLPKIEAEFSGEFTAVHETAYDDYVYSAQKLRALSGRALSSKRNHINNFESAYPDWKFEPLSKAHIPLCLEITEKWRKAHTETGNTNEENAIRFAFQNFDKLNMTGGVLFTGSKHIAFTLGERLCSDTFVVHFEKSDGDINGAYTMINREFVRFITELYPDIKYINREEDMGLENLRKAKESYHPDFMVKKYRLIQRRQ